MDKPIDLLTAIEACRPGAGDLDAPEMAPLRDALRSDATIARRFESMQRFDCRLGEAIRQGDVPAGLEDRILAALASLDETLRTADETEHRDVRRISRRRMGASLAVAAALAAVATGVTVWALLSGDTRLTMSTIQENAADWCDGLVPARWRDSNAPSNFPFSRDVRLAPNAWQPVSPPGAGDAVAYRLPPPPGVRRMTLLVLKVDVSNVPHIPRQDPYMTQDRLVALWQVGENVYVLVLQGDDLRLLQDVYQQSVNTQLRAA